MREATRLQSFPDNFVFEGMTEQYLQVGNHSSSNGKSIADAIKELFEGEE